MAPLSMTFGHSSGLADVAIVRAPTDGTAHLITTGADTLIMARPLNASSKTPVDTSAEQEVRAAHITARACSRTFARRWNSGSLVLTHTHTGGVCWGPVCELRMPGIHPRTYTSTDGLRSHPSVQNPRRSAAPGLLFYTQRRRRCATVPAQRHTPLMHVTIHRPHYIYIFRRVTRSRP